MKKFSQYQGPHLAQNTSQLIRGHFGLTQPTLANLLGVSRSALAMSEQGEMGARSLPPEAWRRLTVLALALPMPDGPAPVPAVPTAVVLAADERNELEMRLQRLTLDEYPIRQRLARCQTQLAQVRLRQQALPALRAALPANDERAQRWLSSFAEGATLMLQAEESLPPQLELKLRVLAFEKTEITRLLAEVATS